MASRVVLMNALFDQLISFVKELSEMYPEDADFAMFGTTLKMVRSTNPSLVVKYVHDAIQQFEDQIMKKDDKFFIEYSFSEYEQDVDLNIIPKLKTYYTTMSEQTKNNVWQYVQNITKLAKALNTQ